MPFRSLQAPQMGGWGGSGQTRAGGSLSSVSPPLTPAPRHPGTRAQLCLPAFNLAVPPSLPKPSPSLTPHQACHQELAAGMDSDRRAMAKSMFPVFVPQRRSSAVGLGWLELTRHLGDPPEGRNGSLAIGMKGLQPHTDLVVGS